MRGSFGALTAALVLMMASPAAAAEPIDAAEPESKAPRVGIGAKIPVQIPWLPGTIEGLGGLSSTVPSGAFLIPVLVGEDLRLEPHVALGFSRRSAGRGEQQGALTSADSWSVDAGVALHHLWSPFEATQGYAGVVAGLTYGELSSERDTGNGEMIDSESSSRGVYAGPVLGGEYQPTETVGFGVEVSLAASYSTHSSTSSGLSGLGGSERDISDVEIRSQASLFARVYLW